MAMALAMTGFLVIFFIVPSMNKPAPVPFVQGPETTLAVNLSSKINALPPIDNSVCNGMPTAIANIVTIIQNMDHSLGTSFRSFQLDASQCDVVIYYLPILGSYNSLITASRNVNPDNSTSVKVFYEDLFMLSSDFIVMNDSAAYKIAFKATGELNDALGLATLRSVCGDDCYPIVLSGIHWVIRDYTNQFICQFESYLISLSIPFTDKSC
jgi:hypothetical protein